MKLRMAAGFAAALGLTAAAIPLAHAETTADPYAAIITRDFGTAGDELAAVESEVDHAAPAQYPAIETKLIGVLQAPNATRPGKQFACQMLRIVGSSKCVPAVAPLLADDQLAHMARFVFQGMHDPAVDSALLTALSHSQGKLRIGIINVLGDRHDPMALRALAPLLKGQDNAVTLAALNAIARIGGKPAADTLDRAKLAPTLQPAWSQAYLRTAESVAAAGDAGRSQKMLRSLLDSPSPEATRAGALVAFAQTAKERATPLILSTFLSNDRMMREAAVSAVIADPGRAATASFVQGMSHLPTEQKVELLGALAVRGDAAGLTDTVNKLASDTDPAIRLAAIGALGRLGDASSVPVLASALGDPAFGGSATRVLTDLTGNGVSDSLIRAAGAGDAGTRSALIGILAQRAGLEALPVVRQASTDNDPKVRQAGLNALSTLGGQEDLQRLSDAIVAEKDEAMQETIASALSGIGGRLTDKATRVDPILQALPKATGTARDQLLTVLSTLGGDKALQAERAALAETGEAHTAALRGLAAWPDTSPMEDLHNASKVDPDKTNQVLALQGYIRMVGLSGQKPDAEVQAYRDALDLAQRPDEKRMVLGGLSGVATADSLKAVEPFLDNADLKAEAYSAYEKIAEGLAGGDPTTAKQALQRVVDGTNNNDLKNKAQAALGKIK